MFSFVTACGRQDLVGRAGRHPGCWWHSSSARVSHNSDEGLIPAPCSYLIKVNSVTCEKSAVQFDPTKHRRFSPGTPVSSCGNTGPMHEGWPLLDLKGEQLR